MRTRTHAGGARAVSHSGRPGPLPAARRVRARGDVGDAAGAPAGRHRWRDHHGEQRSGRFLGVHGAHVPGRNVFAPPATSSRVPPFPPGAALCAGERPSAAHFLRALRVKNSDKFEISKD